MFPVKGMLSLDLDALFVMDSAGPPHLLTNRQEENLSLIDLFCILNCLINTIAVEWYFSRNSAVVMHQLLQIAMASILTLATGTRSFTCERLQYQNYDSNSFSQQKSVLGISRLLYCTYAMKITYRKGQLFLDTGKARIHQKCFLGTEIKNSWFVKLYVVSELLTSTFNSDNIFLNVKLIHSIVVTIKC